MNKVILTRVSNLKDAELGTDVDLQEEKNLYIIEESVAFQEKTILEGAIELYNTEATEEAQIKFKVDDEVISLEFEVDGAIYDRATQLTPDSLDRVTVKASLTAFIESPIEPWKQFLDFIQEKRKEVGLGYGEFSLSIELQ